MILMPGQDTGIHAIAEAMRAYARQAKNRDLEVDAAEIRIRAERKLGELIIEQKTTVGLAKGGGDTSTGSRKVPVQELPTLADDGIDKKLSSRAQKVAAVPEDKFEADTISVVPLPCDGSVSRAMPRRSPASASCMPTAKACRRIMPRR